MVTASRGGVLLGKLGTSKFYNCLSRIPSRANINFLTVLLMRK